MKPLLTLTLIFFLHTLAFSQIIITSTVKEANYGKPLSYVNIGVIGKNIGTVFLQAGKARAFLIFVVNPRFIL